MASGSQQLLSGASSTGQWMPWQGGRGVFQTSGTINALGSVRLEMKGPDGATPIVVSDTAGNPISLSASGTRLFELPDCEIRVALNLASNISARVDRVPR